MPIAIDLEDVSIRRDHRHLLAGIDWRVPEDQRWVVLGPNGSGKTTLLQVASLALRPTSGRVSILGEQLGKTDVRVLRRRIAMTSAAVSARLRGGLRAYEAVMAAKNGSLEPWWDSYDEEDAERARSLLDRFGAGRIADQHLTTLSSGEHQRMLLARAFMLEPHLLLLDEPMAAMDLGTRETLIAEIAKLAADPAGPPLVLVTHHVEEIPAGFTHTLLLRDGRRVDAGPIAEVLTDEGLSVCFSHPLQVRHNEGRWSARSAGVVRRRIPGGPGGGDATW